MFRFRAVPVIALLAGLLALPAAAADMPEASPYVGVDPGTARSFDLQGGQILEPLPFDVQFYLQSKVDDTVAEARAGEPPPVTGTYRGAKTPLTCDELYPPAATSPQTRYLCPNAACDPPPPGAAPPASAPSSDRVGRAKKRLAGEIDFVRFFLDAENGNARTVELSVPALPPDRTYCFEFHLRRELQDLAEFRQQLGAEIDRKLRDPRHMVEREGTTVFVASVEGYNLLRQHLIDAVLAQLRPGEQLEAPAKSFFDPASSLWQVDVSYLSEFNDLVEAQNQRFPATKAYERDRLQAAAALGNLVASERYAALGTSAQACELLGAGAVVLDISKDDALRLAQGLAPGAQPPDLAAVWTAAELAPQISNLRATLQDLRALQQLAERVGSQATLAAFFGLDQAGAGELLQLVKDAGDWIEKTATDLGRLQRLLAERAQGIQAIADSLGRQLTEVVRILGTTTAPYEIRAGWYLSADVGAGLAWDVEETFTYAGMNVYFRPVNKKAPLSGGILKRFSITYGITNENLEQEGKLKGVIGTSSLLVAGGFRINQSVRLALGGLVFREESPDPLRTDQRLTWTPFVSVSVDLNLRGMFTNAFSKGK